MLTREPVEAYAAALAGLGLEVVAMPVTEQRASPADHAALVAAVSSGSFTAVLVASAHAAEGLAAALASTVIPASELGEIWAVGPATAGALAAARLDAHHPDSVTGGAELARALVAAHGLAGRRVLVPHAEDGRPEALAILRAAGADVVDVVAYRTIARAADHPDVAAGRALLIDGGAAVCAVFAPSQVHALLEIVGGARALAALATQFVAIGETTGAALRAAGVEPRIARSPTPAGLAEAVARAPR